MLQHRNRDVKLLTLYLDIAGLASVASGAQTDKGTS